MDSETASAEYTFLPHRVSPGNCASHVEDMYVILVLKSKTLYYSFCSCKMVDTNLLQADGALNVSKSKVKRHLNLLGI